MSINKNDEFIVNIIDDGINGEGIAKIDNFTVFVKGAIKGEKAKIKIIKVLTSHAYGKILEIIDRSVYRKNPDCDTYNRCGGCCLRHIDYEYTLKIKKNIVENVLRKQGLDYIKVNDVLGMKKPYYYRNKLQYPLGLDKANNKVMGVFEERSHNVINTEKCMIQNKLIQSIANDIFTFIKSNNISVYNEKSLKGIIRHIIIRVGIKTNEVMCTLVLNEDKIEKEVEEKFVEYITKRYSQIKTIIKNINSRNTNVILGDKNIVLYGNGYIYDDILGYKFKISNMSFYQVNPVQTEVLYLKAIEYASLKGEETILDLYCGIGTIGICASKKSKKLYGIETIKEAIDDARENAKINNISNAEFFVGDVEKKLPEFIKKNNIKPDVIFIDPPRKGCDKTAIYTILNIVPKKIVYVSCNPSTLARDLKMFEEKYDIKEITPVDMFPFTSHVECCVLLELKNCRPLLNLLAFKIQLCFIKEVDLD